MIKAFSSISLRLAVLFCIGSLQAQDNDTLAATNTLLQDIQRYELELQNLEGDFGPFDERLLEPLGSIEAIYEQLGDFERVLEIQTRRLQLVRTSRGLEHPDSIPLVEAMIRTEIQLGNWAGISDQLDHLLTLAQENYARDSDQVMHAMERQASWHMARVYLDRNRDRAENFMEAREIYDELLDLAEERFGEDDPRLIPWLYKRAHSLALLVALLNSEGSLRGDAIDETIREDGQGRLQTANRGAAFPTTSFIGPSSRVPVVNGREPVGVYYLRLANGYIDDIRDIAEAEDDWETWAMASIYYADYAFLRGRNIGRSNYRDAREKLVELGFDEERLDRFFSRPMPIPVPRFYARFDEMEAYQNQLSQGLELTLEADEDIDPEEPWREPVHVGRFLAWEDDVGAAQRPVLEDPLFAMDLPIGFVDLSFRVNGNGIVSAVDILHAEPDERRARRDAIRAVRAMRFRPTLYDGRSRARPDVQIRYLYLPEQD